MKKQKIDRYRVKFCSVVIQPKVEANSWLKDNSEKEMELILMNSAFPIHTEVLYALKTLMVGTIYKTNSFGTVETRIPHYQIYLEFKVLVRKSSIYEELANRLGVSRVHRLTEKVWSENYKDYCFKNSSNFEFHSNFYWNIKLSSDTLKLLENNLVKLRKNLAAIMENYFTGQKLFKLSEPDDRTGIWLADGIGGTGKTILDDSQAQGCYLRGSDDGERLSSKLRKKYN